MPHGQMSSDMQKCIENCLQCHGICIETIEHCLDLGGEHTAPEHIRLLTDCAEICQASVNFMLRGSSVHPQVCAVCDDVCERCAQDCERFGDDKMMKDCAEVCRRCAESCGRMAQMAHPA